MTKCGQPSPKVAFGLGLSSNCQKSIEYKRISINQLEELSYNSLEHDPNVIKLKDIPPLQG